MSSIRLEFSYDNDFGYTLVGASVQTADRSTPASPNVKIDMIDGKVFLNKFYKNEPITLKGEQGEEFQISIDDILGNFVSDENDPLYLIFEGPDDLCAVWESYDEEIYRRYHVFDICTICKFEMMIAAEEDLLDIHAQSILNDIRYETVRGSEILDYYENIDDDNADDESEYGESEPVPPSFCPHPGMCYNCEDDPDMCDKCGGF